MSNYTISITFGDQAENHHGMQKIGEMRNSGLSVDQLIQLQNDLFCEMETEMVWISDLLNEESAKVIPEELRESQDMEACVLIIRNGVSLFLDELDLDIDDLDNEQKCLDFDKKAKMRGMVKRKWARWNLCFGDDEQEPDYENGKGRIVSWVDVPILNFIKEALEDNIVSPLVGELNYYYDTSKCGIGFHGDTERRIVICVRLGNSMPMDWVWYYQGERVTSKLRRILHNGDIYIMSSKAVGYDWRKRKIPTIRHAAGSDKYTK